MPSASTESIAWSAFWTFRQPDFQQPLAAQMDLWNGGEGLARPHRAHAVDAREDGSVVIGCSADEHKERRPGQNEMTRRWLSIKLLMRSSAEANPVLDRYFTPGPRASRRAT
jgi:hypothetical protein